MKTFLAFASAALSAPAWAAEAPAERYLWGPQMMWGWGWYGMIFGPLFMVLGLAAAIAAAALIVRWIGGLWPGTERPHRQFPARTPLDILKERFARGEIDKNEFEERRRALGD